MIVANTAKNMLAKKHPLLFSDLAVDDEGEAFEYQIEEMIWRFSRSFLIQDKRRKNWFMS